MAIRKSHMEDFSNIFFCELQFFILTRILFPADKLTLAVWTPSLSHPTIPSLKSCTYEELLCKDNTLHKNVFSLFPFLPHITGLLSLNQWGVFFFLHFLSLKKLLKGSMRLIFLFLCWRKQQLNMLRALTEQWSLQKLALPLRETVSV